MRAFILAGVITVLGGCVDAPPYYYAERVAGETFAPLNTEVGVYPDVSVLRDPANPFVGNPIGAETRWEIQAYGDPVLSFYCWATLLTAVQTGEHQYYAALSLKQIYLEGRAAPEDLPAVRELAIAAHQAVLDNFPGSVTFNAAGTIAYGLATPAYQGILELEGAPTGGWTLVTTADGSTVAVKTSEPPALEEEL